MAHLTRTVQMVGIAAFMAVLTIIGHELAHYTAALVMGAKNVTLHWADVAFDETSVGAMRRTLIALSGPVFTHAIILWVWLRGSQSVAALGLGLGAVSRDLVLLPFTLKLMLGRDVTGFTNDEARAAQALDIAQLGFALVAAGLGVCGLVVFLRRAYRAQNWVFPVALVAGVVLGIVFWSVIGPLVLSGGRGYD